MDVHGFDVLTQWSRVLFAHSNIDLTYIKFKSVTQTTKCRDIDSHFKIFFLKKAKLIVDLGFVMCL